MYDEHGHSGDRILQMLKDIYIPMQERRIAGEGGGHQGTCACEYTDRKSEFWLEDRL